MEATTLTSLLAAASLTHLRHTLEDEELTDLKTLKWIITDESSDFSVTMQEIGVSAQDAVALKLALLPGDGPEPAASVPPACTAPAAVIAPPVVVVPAKLEPPAKKVKAEVSLAAFLEGVKLPQLVEKLQSADHVRVKLWRPVLKQPKNPALEWVPLVEETPDGNTYLPTHEELRAMDRRRKALLGLARSRR